ncbi:MAG: DUF5682 family protein [Oscillospiraceae bacterium]|nr:DUF5682 family protein [Oscillospiraceae bacterium]
MDTLAGSGYDLTAPVLFFPVRHHSPACAWHLERTLRDYQPDAILVEGPCDSDHLIAHISAPDSLAPLSIYYQCTSENEDGATRRHACYFPLMDYSPELVAIRYGAANSISTSFIDLPYGELARIDARAVGEEGKESYFDDYYISRSRYIERLCEKQNCRHYSELWEKLFEIGGLSLDTSAFVANMRAFCHFSRVEYPDELLQKDGCAAREDFMAEKIREAMKVHCKVLVVTGGFHTEVLERLIAQPSSPARGKRSLATSDSYLIAYSMAECDQLMGYSSGMPYPAYYQAVYENLDEPETASQHAITQYLAKIGGALRRRGQPVSIADEVASVIQARGLAGLRDKAQPGVYELLDGVLSAYMKGEANAASSTIFAVTTEILRGDKMGKVSAGVEKIPLLLDFEKQLSNFKLKQSTTRREVTLEILNRQRHREMSAFFYCLAFLDVGFAERCYGPDYSSLDTSRVREKWSYAGSARVIGALVDVSHLGGTIREAALTKLLGQRAGQTSSGAATRLLIDAVVMGLTEQLVPMAAGLGEVIALDSSFFSLTGAGAHLCFLENACTLLELPAIPQAEELLLQVYEKSCAELCSLSTANPDEDAEFARALKSLYQISRRSGMDTGLFTDALLQLVSQDEPPVILHGAAVGFLYSAGILDAEQAIGYAKAYLFGSGEIVRKAGMFFTGLLMSAWDLLFSHSGFVEGLSDMLSRLSHEDFLVALPDLRLAFSVLSPSQTDRLARVVAELLGVTTRELQKKAVPEELLLLGRELNAYAEGRRSAWIKSNS